MKGPFLMENSQYYSRANHDIAITGMMLGLALLFQFLSKFMPLVPNLMNINLSLIFIIPIFFLANYKYGMLALILRLAIGPAITYGYTEPEMVGHFILFIAALIFIHLLLLFNKIRMFSNKWGMYIGVVLATIISTLVMTVLNGLIFIPWYNHAYGGTFSRVIKPSLGVNSYWGVIFAVYITGNLINYGITSFVLVPVLKLIKPKLNNNNKLAK